MPSSFPTGAHEYFVYCLDWKSGNLLWEKKVHKAMPSDAHHVRNTYASETPVTDGERLYVYFGNVGFTCLDFEGNELWKLPVGPFATKLSYGTGASPVLHDGRLFLVSDTLDQSFIMAVDAKSGNELSSRLVREPVVF